MKKVYICSPYKGNVESNIKLAKRYSRLAYKKGLLPICVHIYLEEATGLHEKNGDRKKLLQLGREMIEMCDLMWVCTENISEGMIMEIVDAWSLRIPIYHVWKRGRLECNF